MRKTKRDEFMKTLNEEIDRRIQIINAGEMEPVIRMKKFDYVLSGIIMAVSFVSLVGVYFMI